MIAHEGHGGVVIVRGDDAVPVPLLPGAGSAMALIWPGMGARYRSMHRLAFQPGTASIVLRHESDAVYYVVDGAAEFVDVDTGEASPCDAGTAVHIDAGTRYQLRATSGPATVVGGPCPADPSIYPAAAADSQWTGALGASTREDSLGDSTRAS
jgi:mannose-6-phosphate isomerase-like protein (cupin superfamily)